MQTPEGVAKPMDLTADQVCALAPDAGSAHNGRKLATPKIWKNLGCDDTALWGECQGSALYQVRVDLRDLGSRCSCPSRKFPCKHALGLLLLMAAGDVPTALPPPWVAEWIARRAAPQNKAQTVAAAERPAAQTNAAQARRAAKRVANIQAGLDSLALWLEDLVRNGLAAVESQPSSFWEKQAARLVDAQAPALAGRVRKLAAIPGSGRDWPERLLAHLGKIALLIEAFNRQDSLDAPLQEDVRAAIGWTLKEDEVQARGESVRDRWVVLGQYVEDDERVRTQRTWLRGLDSGRSALVLQFSVGSASFGHALLPGSRIDATLTYWPGAYPQRALVRQHVATGAFSSLYGDPDLGIFLQGVAQALAAQPWIDRFPCVLGAVTPLATDEGPWQIVDGEGLALPLAPGTHWKLLSLSGGMPLELAAEWNGEYVLPLAAAVDGAYHSGRHLHEAARRRRPRRHRPRSRRPGHRQRRRPADRRPAPERGRAQAAAYGRRGRGASTGRLYPHAPGAACALRSGAPPARI
jgi:SWIM zinc finger